MIMDADLGDLSEFDKFFDNVMDERPSESQDHLVEGTHEKGASLCTTGADLRLTGGGVIVAQPPDTTLEEYQTGSKGAGGGATLALGVRAQV
jgi:hypothetical protein